VILSILATVAVLAAIATVAAALFLAETTLVYIALGLGGISVLLLLAALVQGGISTGRQERTRTGTDGLGKSSVPAVVTTAATPPGTYGEAEDSGRVPAPAHHGPVRDTVVSGQEVPGVTPAPGDWPQPATGSLGPDPAGPYGDVPAEEALPAPRPEASEPDSPAFTYRIPHQGRAEDLTRTSAEGAVAEPGGEEPDTGERADRTPVTGEDDSAGSAGDHGADGDGTHLIPDDPWDDRHAAPHDTETPDTERAYAADEVDEPSPAADEETPRVLGREEALAEHIDGDPEGAGAFGYGEPRADGSAWPDGTAGTDTDRSTASEPRDESDDAAQTGANGTEGDADPAGSAESAGDAEFDGGVESAGDAEPTGGVAFTRDAEPVEFDEPVEPAGDAQLAWGVESTGDAEAAESTGGVEFAGGVEPAGSAESAGGVESAGFAETVESAESARSTERAESDASAESDEPVGPTGFAADAEPAQPAAPGESAEEGTGTADADEPTGSDTGGATAFSYRVPSADAARADGSDADGTAAFTYRVPGTAAGGATGPDADEDADVAYAAILDGEDEPSAPDRTSRPQDPDQVS
jgi:hypothetical protein